MITPIDRPGIDDILYSSKPETANDQPNRPPHRPYHPLQPRFYGRRCHGGVVMSNQVALLAFLSLSAAPFVMAAFFVTKH